MARKITVTIRADITLETTKEMEKIIKASRKAEDNDDWDLYNELDYKLEQLLADEISKKITDIKDVDVLDTNWD